MSSAGAGIIGVSSDPVDELEPLRERLNLPFALYADPKCETIRALGIYHEDEPKGRDIARPTVYVLDADRTIRYRYVGTGLRDRPATADILQLVRSL